MDEVSNEQDLHERVQKAPADAATRAELVGVLLGRGQLVLAGALLGAAPDPDAEPLRPLVERLAGISAAGAAPVPVPAQTRSHFTGCCVLVLGVPLALVLTSIVTGFLVQLLSRVGVL